MTSTISNKFILGSYGKYNNVDITVINRSINFVTLKFVKDSQTSEVKRKIKISENGESCDCQYKKSKEGLSLPGIIPARCLKKPEVDYTKGYYKFMSVKWLSNYVNGTKYEIPEDISKISEAAHSEAGAAISGRDAFLEDCILPQAIAKGIKFISVDRTLIKSALETMTKKQLIEYAMSMDETRVSTYLYSDDPADFKDTASPSKIGFTY